jgi:hypothetical protein
MVMAKARSAKRAPASCPFCGQGLANRAAVDRLSQEQERFEQRIRHEAEGHAQASADAQLKAQKRKLEREFAAKARSDSEAKTNELEALKRELAKERKTQALSVRQTVNKKLAEAKAQERARVEQEYTKRQRAVDATVQKLQDQNSELSRRVERLSAADRGEYNEEEIYSQLQRAFPDDEIRKTRRGQRGADIFQEVRLRTGSGAVRAGTIVYECKDTLTWNNAFIAQLQRAAVENKTPYVVLISRCFPRNQKNLFVKDGVIVVDPGRAVALAGIVRRMVIETHRSGLVTSSQAEKTKALYRYISSTEFNQAFACLATASDRLSNLLGKERSAHHRVWAEREHVYGEVSEKVVQIDARFKMILESGSAKGAIRQIRQGASTA